VSAIVIASGERPEIVMELSIFLWTAALVGVTWLLYKLAEWLEPRP
jgi:hypothetical protein